ncbi:MAG TPA: hypothetical protein VL088_06995, partial [Pedobacter sp.]|nr:hypothetical protein [Pedobacter sp.]
MTENNGVDHVEIMDPAFNTWPVYIGWKIYAGGYGSSQVTEFSGSFGGYTINWAGYFDPTYNYQPIISN